MVSGSLRTTWFPGCTAASTGPKAARAGRSPTWAAATAPRWMAACSAGGPPLVGRGAHLPGGLRGRVPAATERGAGGDRARSGRRRSPRSPPPRPALARHQQQAGQAGPHRRGDPADRRDRRGQGGVRARHPRRQRPRGPFVAINCAALPRRADRERAVRVTPGAPTREANARQAGPDRGGRGRDAVPRRDRRDARRSCRPSCCAFCRTGR